MELGKERRRKYELTTKHDGWNDSKGAENLEDIPDSTIQRNAYFRRSAKDFKESCFNNFLHVTSMYLCDLTTAPERPQRQQKAWIPNAKALKEIST